jgi:tRNA(fMet)-specific endonuclease VapC
MLDTKAVSAVVMGRAVALAAMLDEHAFCVSVITEAELRFGLARRPINADLRRIVEAFLRSIDIRSWTSVCAERYAQLRTELETTGKALAPMDLLIATQAFAEGCTLVTADQALAQVPGLKTLDWSVCPAA